MLPGPMGAASAAGESPFVPQGNRSPVVDAPNADLERALNAPRTVCQLPVREELS